MEYVKDKNKIFFRLDKGDEVLECLKDIALKENIIAGQVNAIGASNRFIIGLYAPLKKQYFKKEFKGDYEITSLIGNITRKNEEIYLHLHLNASGEDYMTFGGHLNECYISVTMEGFVEILDEDVNREFDSNIGINLIKFC